MCSAQKLIECKNLKGEGTPNENQYLRRYNVRMS